MTSVVDNPTLQLEYLEAIRDIGYQLVAALSFLAWDVFLTFEEETEYIWRMQRYERKWVYFCLRYSLLAAQIFNLAIFPTLSSKQISHAMCMLWYRYVMVILQGSLFLVDVILATRVFALFNRSHKVAVFLSSLILFEIGFAGSSLIRCPVSGYTEVCILPRLRPEMVGGHALMYYLRAVIIVVQSVIMGMIMFKQSAGVRLGWGRIPLFSFFLRDATSNCATVSLVCIASMAACGVDNLRSVIIVYWAISFYSSVGCRLILNMERFARARSLEEDIQLTSHITL